MTLQGQAQAFVRDPGWRTFFPDIKVDLSVATLVA
jgi:hypothetical protein